MMSIRGARAGAVLLIVGATLQGLTAVSARGESPTFDTLPFQTGHAPTNLAAAPGHERAQAVNGGLYAVVAPLYIGTGGFYSYLRLFNGGASTATFSVTVVGSPTGTNYGTATFQVPARASIQYSMSQVLVGANATIRAPDTNFSFYLQSTEPLAGYQHVTHSPGAAFFQNASVCKWTIQDAVSAVAPSAILTHVHTSQLAAQGYPSAIELHNFAGTAVTYRFTVIEASSGNVVGEMNFPTRANASYTIPWSDIEGQINWAPTSSQIYANIVVSDVAGAAPAVLLGQTVINDRLNATLNVTTMCAVNAPPTLRGDGR
ncbi:MAG: hypothetical protein LCH56_07220 [Proteobacteria bacterium]|nr:hypothetical protein [Pseudomonadota bacterium]